jgi:hypothetical protein
MKKQILVTIFAVLLLGALITMPVFAASATANVSSVSANRGGSVTVTAIFDRKEIYGVQK